MNASSLARQAYGSTRQAAHTPRQLEYEAFARATRLLSEASTQPENTPAVAAALHENRRLWILLASTVASEENGLPEMLRARIFYLSEFVQGQSQKILKGEEDIAPLIDINRSIMVGLRSRGGPK